MAKTDVLHIRVEPDVKANAELTLSKLGLSTSDAINVFLNQVVLRGGLPFEVMLPKYNNETLLAMKEAKEISNNGEKGFKNTKGLFEELNK